MFSEESNSKILLAHHVPERGLTTCAALYPTLSLLIWKNKFLRKSTAQPFEKWVISKTKTDKVHLTVLDLLWKESKTFFFPLHKIMQKLLAASSASSFRSNSIIAHKALPPCKTSGQHLTGEHAPIWKASLLTEKKNHKDSIKKTASETFSCVCRASLSGNAGKVTWGCWEIRFQSHLQLSANSLIRNTICAIKAGVYSWFLRSSLDFSHALRKAEMLLKSMLHTAAWEAFPAVRSFCWCWFIWPAQEFLSSELIFF